VLPKPVLAAGSAGSTTSSPRQLGQLRRVQITTGTAVSAIRTSRETGYGRRAFAQRGSPGCRRRSHRRSRRRRPEQPLGVHQIEIAVDEIPEQRVQSDVPEPGVELGRVVQRSRQAGATGRGMQGKIENTPPATSSPRVNRTRDRCCSGRAARRTPGCSPALWPA